MRLAGRNAQPFTMEAWIYVVAPPRRGVVTLTQHDRPRTFEDCKNPQWNTSKGADVKRINGFALYDTSERLN